MSPSSRPDDAADMTDHAVGALEQFLTLIVLGTSRHRRASSHEPEGPRTDLPEVRSSDGVLIKQKALIPIYRSLIVGGV